MSEKVDSGDIRLKQIGAKLKALRIQKGYRSYETFALENDFDRKQYWRIERGHNLTLQTLIRLLDSHQLTLSAFFSELE